MKAQFVKTFIKAAAIVALATSIANCGAMPEESITETTYQPSSQPTAPADPVEPTVTNTDESEPTLIKDGCEAFGFLYDAANNTCVDDEHETNIINPPVEDPNLDPDPIVDEPGDLGGGDNVINPPTELNEEDDIISNFNFTVTPGEYKLVVTWNDQPGVSSYRLERTKEGNSYTNDWYPNGHTELTYATYFCSAHSFKLVANMMDGSVIESIASDFVKPTNCE
jgi:hypothetical protein